MTPLLTLSITILSIVLAAGCWAIMSGVMFGRFDSMLNTSFFNSQSWVRKYYLTGRQDNDMIDVDYYFGIDTLGYLRLKTIPHLVWVLPQWYYDHFKVRYVERFPFSATLLVFVTDAYHLAQWFAIKFICLAIAINTPAPVVYFFLLWLAWVIAFQLVYLNIKK